MTIEQIVAEKLHTLNFGVYDEDGTTGNIFLMTMPEEMPKKFDYIISVVQSSSLQRSMKIDCSVKKPLMTIFIKGKKVLKIKEIIEKIADSFQELEWETDKYKVIQSFPTTEAIFLGKDEKGFNMYDINILINYINK